MKKYFLAPLFLFPFLSCKIQPNSDRHFTDRNDSKVYRLRLNPVPGSKYHYDISNESELKFEAGDKKADNQNKSQVGVYYTVSKDSMGDYLFTMVYDKLHLSSKNNDTETEMDADSAGKSLDPVEKMLGELKSATVMATISPLGVVKSVTGYKELGDKIMAGFSASDSYARNIARTRWEQVIGKGIIKKNMDQLFNIFPDSAVHVGDRWKLSVSQKGEFSLNEKNSYLLKAIKDGVAYIESEGEMESDSTATNLVGYDVVASLKGRQKGVYEMETTTGMLLDCHIKAEIEGSIQLMGRDIPITMTSNIKMKGRNSRKNG